MGGTTDNIKEQVGRDGFVFIPRFMSGEDSEVAFSRLGEFIEIPGLQVIQTLIPRAKDSATPNIYSGNFGYEEFPLHTDLAHWHTPPKYIALRCVIGAGKVTTRLFDGQRLISDLKKKVLERALVQPRRLYQRNKPILRILDRRSVTETILRWDSLFLSPATKLSNSTCAAVGAYLKVARVKEILLQQPGDTLLFDNWRFLHGRSCVPGVAIGRRISRVYLRGIN